jgi:hypothetical protein
VVAPNYLRLRKREKFLLELVGGESGRRGQQLMAQTDAKYGSWSFKIISGGVNVKYSYLSL